MPPRYEGSNMQVLALGGAVPQIVSLSASSAVSTILVSPQSVVRIWSSVDCFIRFGADASVVATTSSHPLTAKIPEIYQIAPNCNFLAAIVSSGTGSLFISLYQ